MAPKAGFKTWDDALEKKFLLEVIERVGVPGSVLSDIAAKWGPPHTKGSLAIKYNRLKNASRKEESIGAGDSKIEGLKGSTKHKLSTSEEDDEYGNMKVKKVKTEAVGDDD